MDSFVFALGGRDEVKGTGKWKGVKIKRKEDGSVQFGEEEKESPKGKNKK
eukprot:CAMPEP_0171635246 /NCGR_PEP_ID=MMETSP0990-20121206/26539_1 /TAXON_ID=483369 /ORGANISM="non described non described, Strain CCMP2098" /LENGTH=49 /DNA_ID=CAMNT_0012206827 /DNA_START=176 /DNA_END=325 /DNA_ORIENTATION=-